MRPRTAILTIAVSSVGKIVTVVLLRVPED